MKQIKRKMRKLCYRLLVLIIVASSFVACQEQNENLTHGEHLNNDIKGVYLNFEELKKQNPNSAAEIQKISENKNYKSDAQNHLKIDYNTILEIQTENFTSYTIQAFNQKQFNKVYNYVITVYPNNEFSQYLIEYPILEDEQIDYKNTSVTKIDEQNLLNRTSGCAPYITMEDTSSCIYTTCRGGENHRYGDPRCDVANNPFYAARRICDMVTVANPDCEPGGGSSDNNDHGEGGDYDAGTGGSNNSGGGTGGTITLPVYDDLRFSILVMGLDSELQNFINHSDNLSLKREMEAFYRDNEYSEEAKRFAEESLEALINYTSIDYPGVNEGLPFEWWKNIDLIENHTFFTQDPYNIWRKLTAKEKEIFKLYPAAAIILHRNKAIAEQSTISFYGRNGLNDTSDAFRHAYFNALNTREMGKWLAKKLSDAHESETPAIWSLEVQMDLFNNDIGHKAGHDYPQYNDIQMGNFIKSKMNNGLGRYLSPINIYDPNFWDNPLTPLLGDGTHGISTTTTLTPTH